MFSTDFVEMATLLACNASAKLPIFNLCRVRMRRLLLLRLSTCSCPEVLEKAKIFVSDRLVARATRSASMRIIG